MPNQNRFLIIDGYPKKSRDQFEEVGMRLAGILYRDLLVKHIPGAAWDLWYVFDAEKEAPGKSDVANYTGVLWPGCNQTVYEDKPQVHAMVAVARYAYATGVPQFGSCWGIQIAAFAAGGGVEPHPQGREMGIARNIGLSEEGKRHPMMEGKPEIYTGFISHDDQITKLPPNSARLAGNDWSPVQAAVFQHQEGTFWGVQYHPEYDLHEMACLIHAREEKLLKQGFFKNHEDLVEYANKMEALFRQPDRKDLRWQLAIGDDILDETIREREFVNWIQRVVRP
jgi:GMP synthase (glutamine-hydrolysing)